MENANGCALMQSASVKLYDLAVRADPHNWVYYEKRIDVLDTLGMDEQVMKTRLAAAKSIDCRLSKVTFEWLRDLIRQVRTHFSIVDEWRHLFRKENNISIYYKGFGVYYIRQVAEFYIAANDEERATEALEIFILRSYEFGLPADSQHLILLGGCIYVEKILKGFMTVQRIFSRLECIAYRHVNGERALWRMRQIDSRSPTRSHRAGGKRPSSYRDHTLHHRVQASTIPADGDSRLACGGEL